MVKGFAVHPHGSVNQSCIPFTGDDVSLYGYTTFTSWWAFGWFPLYILQHFKEMHFLNLTKPTFALTLQKCENQPVLHPPAQKLSQLVGRATAQAPAAFTLKMDFHFSNIRWDNHDNNVFFSFTGWIHFTNMIHFFIISWNKNKYVPKLNTKSPGMVVRKICFSLQFCHCLLVKTSIVIVFSIVRVVLQQSDLH